MGKILSGKIAIVTGGTRGIGRAIAERLLLEGAAVAICGRLRDRVQQAVRELHSGTEGQVLGEVADVSKLDDVRRLFQNVDSHFKGLDILINNAGIGVFKSVRDMTPEEWHRTIDLNLNGAFYCSHEALPRFAARGGGYVINISSLAGKNPFAGGAAYNASKFGLNGFSEAMMLDHRYDNVRVSYVMPGSVDTDFSARSGPASWKISPEDIAEVVLVLLRMPKRTLISRVEMRPSQPMR
jgi:3-oxoacyl-[acyl-carrier protein] reductase